MREIKFRAWDNRPKAKCMLDWFTINQTAFNFNCSIPLLWAVMHDPDINLMQYTGLKDKNGKEIYEGDLLGGDWLTAPVVVKWHENGHWVVEGLNGWDEHLCAYKDIAVVGNIYEHAHLLEPKGIESTALLSGAEADHDPT